VLALLLTTAVIEIPALAAIFEFTPISLKEYGIAMGLAILIIPVVEIVKAIQRSVETKQNTLEEESIRKAKKRD
jgi:Ca2+-transporting ATPase